MALVIADRVRETSTTTGTGTLTLVGAVVGYQTFSTAIGNANTTFYAIVGGAEWETGIGTVGAGTLARTTVLRSSNADAAVNFAVGTKDVLCTQLTDRAVYVNGTAIVAANGAVLGAASGGTGVANNAASTWTVSGAYATTITVTGATGVTLPTSGTLLTTTGSAASLTSFPTLNQNTSGTAAGLSATLIVAKGGTGAATLAANAVLLGNGTTAVQTVAPSTSGNVLTSNGTTWASTAPTAAGLTLGTPVSSTSGTAIDFTSIPAGTKLIHITFNEVSTNGTAPKLIQIGNSGGIEATGYVSSGSSILSAVATSIENSTGFVINSVLAAQKISGAIVLTLQNATTFTWVASGNLALGSTSGTGTFTTAGSKSLSATLDRIRITANGVNTFDAGEINISYM